MDTKRPIHGFTLVEMILVVIALAVVIGMQLPAPTHNREPAARVYCRNNLNQLAKGMATYLNEYGDNRWYPCPLGRGAAPVVYTGAEWLASLYWTGVVPHAEVFLCPPSGDTNHDGFDLGASRVPPGGLAPEAVSYAGMHYGSNTAEPGAIAEDYPPNKPMACDDTQGDINHGTQHCGGMAILFFDSHVEFRTNTELDLEHAVGDTSPDALLRALSN